MKIPCNVITEVSTYDSVVTKVYESGLKAIGVFKDGEFHLVNLFKNLFSCLCNFCLLGLQDFENIIVGETGVANAGQCWSNVIYVMILVPVLLSDETETMLIF